MLRTPCQTTASRATRGLTLIEVVVTILVLVTLFTLLTPRVYIARTPARRAECQNNIKQLTTALWNYASRQNGGLPWLISGKPSQHDRNWVIDLLPDLDQAAVRRAWDDMTPQQRGSFNSPHLRDLTCPEDSQKFGNNAAELSYVANAGYGLFTDDSRTGAVTELGTHSPGNFDWDGDGSVTSVDERITVATGVFWRQHSTTFRVSLDFIGNGDGQSNTIMLTENLNARKWNSLELLDIAFVAGIGRLRFRQSPNSKAVLGLKSADLGPFGVQAGLVPGRSPSPSSNHDGVVNMGFADGSARQISTKIDALIYLRLMTPDGQRFGEAMIANGGY